MSFSNKPTLEREKKKPLALLFIDVVILGRLLSVPSSLHF